MPLKPNQKMGLLLSQITVSIKYEKKREKNRNEIPSLFFFYTSGRLFESGQFYVNINKAYLKY